MSALMFKFGESEVRVQQDAEGETWWSVNDVCEVLELGNPRQSLESHVDEEDVQKMDTLFSNGQTQKANHINESGLYSLIMGSKKPQAKKFKHWVTSEVLPSIRKTGSYSTTVKPEDTNAEMRRYMMLGDWLGSQPGVPSGIGTVCALNAIEDLGVNVTRFRASLGDTQEHGTLNATNLGKSFDLSPQKMNIILNGLGMQEPTSGGGWEMTKEGMKHGEHHPFYNDNSEHVGFRILWKASFVNVLKGLLESDDADEKETRHLTVV